MRSWPPPKRLTSRSVRVPCFQLDRYIESCVAIDVELVGGCNETLTVSLAPTWRLHELRMAAGHQRTDDSGPHEVDRLPPIHLRGITQVI